MKERFLTPHTLADIGIVAIMALTASMPGPACAVPGNEEHPVEASAFGGTVDDSWLEVVTQQIEHKEYGVSSNGIGLQAPNRAHDLRTYFAEDGIEVVPRTLDGASWLWGWHTEGWGRDGHMMGADPGRLSYEGARVEYGRGGLVEWYENSKQGLEQGFDIVSEPPGDGFLIIKGLISGTLRPDPKDNAAEVDFVDGNGVCVLKYRSPVARDAEGRVLDAWLELEGNRLAIAVDDRGAKYPVVVDPLITAPAWIAEGNQADARFGVAVGTAGDVNGDGYSDVVVGAYWYDNGYEDEGRVYLYEGSSSGPASIPSWVVDGNQANALLGHAVGTAGDVNGDGYSDVVVGAPYYTNGENDEGRVYVYRGSATGLETTPSWTAESNQVNALFGRAVGTAGDVNGDGYSDLVVGAYHYNVGWWYDGKVYVYYGSSSGLSDTPSWTVESDQGGAQLGVSVSTAGDVNGDGYSDVVVGARRYDNGPALDEGRAYLYLGSSTGLEGAASWTASAESGQDSVFYGNSVSTVGDVNGDGYADVVVGAPCLTNGENDEGGVYAYYGSATGLSASPSWTAEGNQADAVFGVVVATAGDVNGDGYSDVIVGANRYDNGEMDEGRVYVYRGSATGLETAPSWTAESDQADALFGSCVGAAGDVNGDGYGDVIVGAPDYDAGENNEGRAFVYLGNESGITGGNAVLLPQQQRVSGEPIDLLGHSDHWASFQLAARGRTPAGRARVRLEWNAEPLGTPLEGATINRGSWQDTGPVTGAGSVVNLNELVNIVPLLTPYHWRLRIASDSPYFPHTHWMTISLSVPSLAHLRLLNVSGVELDEDGGTHAAFLLHPATPNPFNPTAKIRFDLADAGRVHLAVYDVTGRLVTRLTDRDYGAGSHSAVWHGVDSEGRAVPSGVYYFLLRSGHYEASRKVILIK